jgi:F0F1-type ATP synthase assembly protein I
VKNQPRSSFRKKPSDSPKEKKESAEDSKMPEIYGFAKYSNIIYLMIGAIGVAFLAGYLLDKLIPMPFPVFKVVFSFGGVILALYLVFKELNRK